MHLENAINMYRNTSETDLDLEFIRVFLAGTDYWYFRPSPTFPHTTHQRFRSFNCLSRHQPSWFSSLHFVFILFWETLRHSFNLNWFSDLCNRDNDKHSRLKRSRREARINNDRKKINVKPERISAVDERRNLRCAVDIESERKLLARWEMKTKRENAKKDISSSK